jgi:DNA-binding response OmpR family regulator
MAGDTPPELVARVLAIEPATGDTLDLASQLTVAGESTLAVQSASSVAAARTALSNERIDCVVCLHDPPSLDGVDVLSALR